MQPMQPSSNPSRLLSLSRSPAAASALAQSAPFAGAEPQESQPRHWPTQLDHAPGCDKMSLCTIAPVYGFFKRLSPSDGASGGLSSDSRKRQAICRPTSEASVCLTLCLHVSKGSVFVCFSHHLHRSFRLLFMTFFLERLVALSELFRTLHPLWSREAAPTVIPSS